MNTYLIRAEAACDYVKKTVRMKTENLAVGINKNQCHIYSSFMTEKLSDDRERLYSRVKNTWSDEGIDYAAHIAEQSKIGNCGEHAVVAFNYLLRRGEKIWPSCAFLTRNLTINIRLLLWALSKGHLGC
ncbi:MAG: hypothetical protein KAH18_08070 [Psychromonas sp.]|nr:hypothetical protein [Psychromonas sp.]